MVKESSARPSLNTVLQIVGKNRDELGRIPQVWTEEKALLESKKYKTKKEFRTKCNSAYQYIVRKGLTGKLNLEGKRHRLDNWDVFCAAKKCNDISEFSSMFPSEYSAFLKRKIDKDLLSHMPLSKTGKKWNHNNVAIKAMEYSFRSDFSKFASGAYDYAQNHGILDSVCSHMTHRNSDYDCAYIWTALQSNGFRLLKVGVTSKRLGTTRIDSVAKASSFTPTDILIYNCGNESLSIERELKKTGQRADIGVFDGSTEFIIVNEKEYLKCKELLCNKGLKSGSMQERTK